MKPPYFLNVDLDIVSKSSLRSLARELGNQVSVMFSGRINGRHCLFLETAGVEVSQDAIIASLCALIEGLSPRNRQVWDAALRKEFDLGYESRLRSQRANRFRIRPSTIRRVAELGASVAVTLYSEPKGEPAGAAIVSQPIRSETNRKPSPAGARRRPLR
jgi:hypothetical protein